MGIGCYLYIVRLFQSAAKGGDSESSEVTDIYPNPVSSGGELKIVFSSTHLKQASLSFYDMSGRKVFDQTIYSSVQTQSIGLPFLATGIYQCVIDYGSDGRRYKLVVSK